MIKVYFAHGPNLRVTREHRIIMQGLKNNARVEVVDNEKDSDFVFQFYYKWRTRYGTRETFPRRKTVIIDYHDNPRWFFPSKSTAYFKRSWVEGVDRGDYVGKRLSKKPYKMYPLTYAIMDEFVLDEEIERDISICCTLREEEGNNNRLRVLRLLKEMNIPFKTQIGRYNKGAMAGFNDENMKAYFKLMRRSQIVVTCNPDKWEGDCRTWEAFASGALVFVDKMITPLAHPLVDGKHCIFYEPSEVGLFELREKILFYLKHGDLAYDIAKAGYAFTMKYHRASNRIDEILDVIT